MAEARIIQTGIYTKRVEEKQFLASETVPVDTMQKIRSGSITDDEIKAFNNTHPWFIRESQFTGLLSVSCVGLSKKDDGNIRVGTESRRALYIPEDKEKGQQILNLLLEHKVYDNAEHAALNGFTPQSGWHLIKGDEGKLQMVLPLIHKFINAGISEFQQSGNSLLKVVTATLPNLKSENRKVPQNKKLESQNNAYSGGAYGIGTTSHPSAGPTAYS